MLVQDGDIRKQLDNTAITVWSEDRGRTINNDDKPKKVG